LSSYFLACINPSQKLPHGKIFLTKIKEDGNMKPLLFGIYASSRILAKDDEHKIEVDNA
jgi:hypothetical protein